ncbi:uncharacterized protein LOC125474953 isoform X3 [Pyrus x bretschneideri]|uniref:uncharacterized protein LOC125474953 isoform X3 n=1 Tax=Pyrus x bretschneideri TaxID=225117 RepID=UPI00202EA849|nr:uncharacterized protein LOC125474953 isoform X3 [Pyrus x bretschneideri]
MEDPRVEHNLWVLWRGKRFDVKIHSGATLKDLGHELQKLTDVKADTMRLIVPKFSDKSSKMLSPFSDEHRNLSLQEASFVEGKSIRMMGVSENEVDEVLQNAKANLEVGSSHKLQKNPDMEPDPDALSDNQNKFELSPHDSQGTDEFGKEFSESMICQPELAGTESREEPDPDNMDIMESRGQARNNVDEPDPDAEDAKADNLGYSSCRNIIRPNHDSSLVTETIKHEDDPRKAYNEPDPDDSQSNGVTRAEPDPDANLVHPQKTSRMQIDEPDPDDQEFQRIQDPVTIFCKCLQENIKMPEAEVNRAQATTVLQTLFKIIRNVLEHPGETKYRKLLKVNSTIQRNVANYKAAMEFLLPIGFNESVMDGKQETYLVLKRDDPGLLWLAKSTLETCIS